MGCCNCNCINKLEHVEKVIAEYDPTEKFINYKLLTIWLNRKTGKAFILVSKKNGIAVWEPINLDSNFVEKILVDCGEIEPNEKGEIIINGQCGIRAVSDDCPDFCINLLTGYGLKGGGQICKGETRTIELDADITGDVRGPDAANVGDVPVFGSTDGKSITTSNINSVDGLTKITKSSKGEQKLLVETVDTEAGSDAGVEAKSTGSGTPYFQLTQGENKWRRIINPETGALEVRPTDDLSKGSILSMLPNGVMLMPWQPKMGATLGDSPYITQVEQRISIGSNLAFTKVIDQDGYNLDANNFFPGDGNGNGAYYVTNYANAFYLVSFQFVLQKRDQANSVTYNIKLNYTGIPSYTFRRQLIPGISFDSCIGFVIIKSVLNGRISLDLTIGSNALKFGSFDDSRNNYLGIYMLG